MVWVETLFLTHGVFPISFTIEYKVGIAEFYLYMGFGADLLKVWSP